MVNVRRRFSGQWTPTPAVLGLLVALLVIQLLYGFSANFLLALAPFFRKLVLTTPDVLDGQVWRLVSYGLLHSLMNPMHLLLNGMVLFFFGRDLEQRWGSARFLLYVLLGVLAGGLCVVASQLLGIGVGNAVGISAAVEAAVVTWALFNRDRQVLLFFVAPVRGIWLIAFAVIMWMLDAVSYSETSAAAHFGGIVFGALAYVVVARRNRLRLLWDDLLVLLRIRKRARLTVVPKGPDKWVH